MLHAAIASAKSSTAPIELLVENGSFQETYKLNYHNGERYPLLERDSTKPDALGEVIKSRANVEFAYNGFLSRRFKRVAVDLAALSG